MHRLELSEVERIRVQRDAGFMTITVWGDDPEGRPLEFPVSMAYVADLEPLARRLDTLVEERPDLLLDDYERRRWEEFRRSGS